MRTGLCTLAITALLLLPAIAVADENARPNRAEALRKAVEGCDRIRFLVESIHVGKGLRTSAVLEITKAEAIETFLSLLEFDEKESGFFCACAGSPRIEFSSGEEALASVTVHHGRSLYWIKGPHHGHGLPTRKCRRELGGFLADLGWAGMLRTLENELTREATLARRHERYREILGDEVFEEVTAKPSEVARILTAALPEARERAAALLRLLGCHEDEWAHRLGVEEAVIEELLPKIEPKDLGGAVEGLLDDPWGKNGSARWILGLRQNETVPAAVLEAVLPRLVRFGLTHPEWENRRLTIAYVSRHGGDEPVRLLREVLAGNLPSRPMPEEEKLQPRGGRIIGLGDPLEITTGADDRIAAAYALGKLGDWQSLPLIAKLLEKGDYRNEWERKLLASVVNQLAD